MQHYTPTDCGKGDVGLWWSESMFLSLTPGVVESCADDV